MFVEGGLYIMSGRLSSAGGGLGEFSYRVKVEKDGWLDGVVETVNSGPLKGGESLGMVVSLAAEMLVNSWE